MRSLQAEGVKTIFGYPGGSIMPVFDALYGYTRGDDKVFDHILVRHEQAAAGGNIGKIKDGDIIVIDIPSRSINVKLSDEELAARPQQPLKRNRVVSKALRAYAQSVSSADKGGVRIID